MSCDIIASPKEKVWAFFTGKFTSVLLPRASWHFSKLHIASTVCYDSHLKDLCAKDRGLFKWHPRSGWWKMHRGSLTNFWQCSESHVKGTIHLLNPVFILHLKSVCFPACTFQFMSYKLQRKPPKKMPLKSALSFKPKNPKKDIN